MALTREQRRVATTIYRRGRRKHVKRKSLLAAIETGLVESGLRNLPGGSGSSVGWRQEISSYGSRRRRMNVAGGADRFFDEIKAKGGSRHFGSAGQVAQAVQRSAYPGRYDQQAKQAKDILRWLERTGGSGGGKGHLVGGDVKGKLQTIPGVSMAADRLAAKQQYLLSDSKSPDALLNLGQQLNDLQDTPAQQVYKLHKTPLRRVGGGKGGNASYPHGKGAHGVPNLLVHIGHLAQKMGLHVGENPAFGGVGGSHVKGSYHYKNEAIDVSGNPRLMAHFAKLIAHRYGRHLAELIHNSPYGAFAIKHGKRVGPGFYSSVWAGHRSHVHVAVA